MSPESAAGAVLSRAFFEDPAICWAVPDDTARRGLARWFTAMTRWAQRFGEVHALGPAEAPTAVSLWASAPADLVQHVRAGLLAPTLALGPGPLLRFMRLGDALAKWHHRLCPEPHRYLAFVGVDPPHQRKGLGAEVLRGELARADRLGLPCYLETATEANLIFYRRLDFSVVHHGSMVPGAPGFWLLKRPMRST
ncbi:MAG: GNAT family N-acetyltransferase [Archangiaceae bacterium]|nr:GNAT family N-acetyltransferase [Archangiaceae bacterium]